MSNKVFYSWQSDTNNEYNLDFIRSVLKDAIEEVKETDNLEFYYDEASREQMGAYDIAESLFQKIKNSTVLLADITSINYQDNDKRKLANPNVLLELGYAAGIIGWKGIISVFNLAHGNLQDIPFDIRNRKIITYFLNENSNKSEVHLSLKRNIIDSLKIMDIEEAKERDAINRVFMHQSEVAKFHALFNRDDEYWHTKLLTELLNSIIYNLKNEYELVLTGIVFEDKQHLNAEDFFSWIKQVMRFQSDVIESLGNIVQTRLVDTLNREKPLEILHLSQMIERLGRRLLELELKRRSLIIDDRLTKYKNYVGTNMNGFIVFVEKLIQVVGTLHINSTDKPRIKNDDLFGILNIDESKFEDLQSVILEVIRDENK